MREIFYTNKYKKDLKLARRRGLDEDALDEIIKQLIQDLPLPSHNKDHALKGNYLGCRECHISPDWLLVYSLEDNIDIGETTVNILNLMRTGTHSDLFKK